MTSAKKPKRTATSKLLGLANKTQVSTYLEHAQASALSALAARTRIAKSVLFREAIDDLLRKHRGAAK